MTTWPRAALLCVIMTLTGCVPWAELRKRIDDAEAIRLGLAVFKVALVWPLETEGVSAFALGKREILVVEETRPVIEQQLKDAIAEEIRFLARSLKHDEIFHLRSGAGTLVMALTDI